MVENKNYDRTVPNISVETIIEASLEEVWESVANIQSHVNWMDDAVSIDFIGDRQQGIGTTFDCETKIGPFKLTDRIEITEWVESKTIGVSHKGLVSGSGQFTLLQLDPIRTTFTWEESLVFPFWMGGPLRNPIGKKILESVWKQNLKNLKELIESGSSSSSPS
tara:strand:+ start:1852 stop:2343 length:492 start_codon:yes stop_codon:yes gene_type:complete